MYTWNLGIFVHNLIVIIGIMIKDNLGHPVEVLECPFKPRRIS